MYLGQTVDRKLGMDSQHVVCTDVHTGAHVTVSMSHVLDPQCVVLEGLSALKRLRFLIHFSSLSLFRFPFTVSFSSWIFSLFSSMDHCSDLPNVQLCSEIDTLSFPIHRA